MIVEQGRSLLEHPKVQNFVKYHGMGFLPRRGNYEIWANFGKEEYIMLAGCTPNLDLITE